MKIIPIILAQAIFFCSCSQKPIIDKIKFEPLYRSAKSIEVATSTGVSLIKFREMIQQTAVELSISKDEAVSPSEKLLIEAYANAFDVYSDSLKLWEAKISKENWFTDGIFCIGDVPEVAVKYEMKCLDFDRNLFIPNESIQYLWAIGSSRIAQAGAIYLGSQPEKQKDLSALKESIYAPIIIQLKHQKSARIENIKVKKTISETTIPETKRARAEKYVHPCDDRHGRDKWCWNNPSIGSGEGGFETKELAIEAAIKMMQYE
jgi:hypothetical protein